MGWLDWLTGKASPPEQPPAEPLVQISVTPPAGAKAFGVDKLATELTEEEVQQSREALWAAGDPPLGWRLDAGLDHRSTLFELAVDGMESTNREDLPITPAGLGYRVAALPITVVTRMRDDEETTFRQSVALLATTREELEARKARIYSKKTSKKETKGKCYFCGFVDVKCQRGQAAGNFLKHTNHLTRVVVLGEDLAADFESRTKRGGITPQEWVETVLRPMVLQGN